MTLRDDRRKARYLEDQLVDKLDATPEPNHFNAFQARQERDLINLQDHLENLWVFFGDAASVESLSWNPAAEEVLAEMLEQREVCNEFLRRLRMISGITLEFPTRTERRAYLRANNMG